MHEWLGIAIAVGLVVHLVQHTNWIVTTTRRIFSATSWRNRLNYLMMGALFLAFVAVIASGLIISEVALPWIGITTNPASFWVWLHLASVSAVLWLTALHVALNWKWIATTARRYVVKPLVSAAPPAVRGTTMRLLNRTLTVLIFAIARRPRPRMGGTYRLGGCPRRPRRR